MGDDFHHNGAFYVMDGWDFYSSFGKPRPQPTTVGPTGFEYYTHDNYKWYLETGALKNILKLTGDSIAFWKELYQHPNRDAWWQARNARVALYDIKPAMLVVGGLYDAEDCFGAWHVYKALKGTKPRHQQPYRHGPLVSRRMGVQRRHPSRQRPVGLQYLLAGIRTTSRCPFSTTI